MKHLASTFFLVFVCTLHNPHANAQQKPLYRTFPANDTEQFRVHIAFKAEIRSIHTETLGNITRVRPTVQISEAKLEWTASRAIKLLPSGEAEITESITQISADCVSTSPSSDPALQKSLSDGCDAWRQPRTLHYFEARDGSLREFADAEIPALGEPKPPLLSLWVRRASRPNVIFPSQPFSPGFYFEKDVQPGGAFGPDARGKETTQWYDVALDDPTAKLHVVQDLSWAAPQSANENSQVRTTFFADSLSDISLLDGRLLSATRSASRETKHTLPPVEGLSEPPQFSTKLTVTISIRRLP